MFLNFLGILFEPLIRKLHFLTGVIFRSFLTPICEYVIFISMCSRVNGFFKESGTQNKLIKIN